MGVIELLWGIGCGLLCLIPGWNVGLSLLVSVYVQHSSLYALVVGLIVGTIVECRINSSNIYGSIFCYNFNISKSIKIRLSKEVIKWKSFIWVIGIIIGLLSPAIYRGTPFYTSLFVIIILSGAELKKNLYPSILWLIIVQVLNGVLEAMAIENNIVVIGTMIYTLPACFNAKVNPNLSLKVGNVNHIYTPNLGSIGVAGLLSIVSPGISPSVISAHIDQNISKTTIINSYLNTILCNVLIESFAYGQLVKGNSVGKSLLSIYSNYVSYSSIVLVIIALIVAYIISLGINNIYPADINPYIISGVGLLSLIVLTGIWALPLVGLTYILWHINKKLNISSGSAQGLSYVSLVL
jgi:hypothetical protein